MEDGERETLSALLQGDREVMRLIAQGLDAWDHIQEAARQASQPSQFLKTSCQWERWDRAYRDSIQNLGPALMSSLLHRRDEIEPLLHTELIEDDSPETLPAPPQPQRSELPTATSWARLSQEEEQQLLRDDPLMESPQTLLEVSPQTLDGPEEPPLDLSPSMLHELQHNMSDIRQAHSPTAIKVRVDHSMAETLLGQVDDLIRLLEVHSTNLWPLTKSYTLPKSLRAYGYMDDAFLDRWACVLSALLREVESEPEVGQVELKDAHYELRGWITRQDLGFIHGLAREHAPKHGSWRGDARHHAKKLRRDLKRSLGYKITERVMDPGTAKRRVGDLLDSYEDSRELSQGLERLLKEGMKADTCVLRLLCPVLDEMQGSNLHGLRKKVRAQNKEDEHEEQREDTQLGVIPGKSWPFWSLTRGRGAVMVGSAGRVHQIASIKEAFGFSDIDVIEAGQGVRRVQALCQRLAQDEDRVVLVMHRYISHKASGMVWGYRDNATIIGVDRGFCVGAVRQAIEKFGPAYLDD